MSTPPPINFAALSLQDALDLATLIEDDARERYTDFVAQLDIHHTSSAAGFFRLMARNETKHRDWIAERRRALFGDTPTRINANQVCDVEAPSFADTEVAMTLREALLVAHRAERRAFAFYRDALQHITDPEIRRLFAELRDEEIIHCRLVQEELDRLPPPTGPAQPIDAPVAQ